MSLYPPVWTGCRYITDEFLCKFYAIRKWDELTAIEKELKGSIYKSLSMTCGEKQEVIDLMNSYKIHELKKIALNNYTNPKKMIGNKSWKKTWAKEVYKVKRRGFNTFVIASQRNKHPLRGQVDVLLMIQNFI